jgi:transketolase
MVSMAAGMALCGLRPVTYTIASFSTVRCLEQIRVDLAYQNLPVMIVGVGGGLSYASLNATHHACEDIAFLRALPNMTVICPGDAWEVRAAVRAATSLNGPVYLRLGKKGETLVHRSRPDFSIGRAIVVRSGRGVCLLSTGNMLPITMEVSSSLRRIGIAAQVVSFHTVKPLDQQMLISAFTDFILVVTIEEHSMIGGLGGGVAEWLADNVAPKARLLRIATSDNYLYEASEQDHARSFYGLSAAQIFDKVAQAYREEVTERSLAASL